MLGEIKSRANINSLREINEETSSIEQEHNAIKREQSRNKKRGHRY